MVFTVLMPSLSTTLITKLGGATTSLLLTCNTHHQAQHIETALYQAAAYQSAKRFTGLGCT